MGIFKILVWVAAIIFTLNAEDIGGMSSASIVQSIKANPALLDTPQAQQLMQEKGVTKGEVLQKVDQATKSAAEQSSSTTTTSTTTTSAVKDTSAPSVADASAIDPEANQKDLVQRFLKNPLTYEEPDARYKRLITQQLKEKSAPLKRYGEAFFENKNGIDLTSLPVPDGYRLSPNDTLSITLYGPRSDAMTPIINRDGNIILPSFGPLHVAGLSFVEAKKVITDALVQAFPNVGVVVSISKYSTIQVTLAGEVAAPGVYSVTSFSTVKDALIVAGGIAPNGSMRMVQVKRANRVIRVVDLYKIIRDGDKRQEVLLQAGDVIVVPIVKQTIILEGGVKNQGIYEPKSDETFASILHYAGGLKAQSSKYDIKLTRFVDNEKVVTLSLDLSHAGSTKLHDQDHIYVYDLASANMRGVTLYGNIVKPGLRPLTGKNMTLGDLLRPEITQLSIKGVFLEQTLFDYAMIKRIDENLSEKMIGFSLADALSNKTPIQLHNRDEIYILNTASVRPAPKVSIGGECVAKAGDYKYLDNMTVYDLINAAGTTCVVDYHHINIVSYDPQTYKPINKTVDIIKDGLTKLTPSDQVTLYNYFTINPIHNVVVSGQVNKPGEYPIGDATTVKDLLLAAGGLTERADQKIEIVHYNLKDGKRVSTVTRTTIADTMGAASPKVMPYDEINVFTIPNWGKHRTVKLVGKVRYPGEYTIQEGEKLVDVLKRAGGFTDTAFLNGTVFTRVDIKKIQQDAITAQIQELEHKATIIAAQPKSSSAGSISMNDTSPLMAMIGSLKEQAKTLDIPGRMTVHLDADLERLAQSPYNVTLKDGDALYVPEKEDSITVVGEVMNPSALIYTTDDANAYIANSGGFKESADPSNAFVIHANGEAEKINKGLFTSSSKVGVGDSIVVPIKLESYPTMLFIKDISSILYQFAVTVAALKTIGTF
ncbi:MAG: SLBB domain-containing protein [Sulfuricurvum sp.]|nr:SLBB domain-containing protein [Sulfuricurvum sp.]